MGGIANANDRSDVAVCVKDQAIDETPADITISDSDREDNPLVDVNETFERVTVELKDPSLLRRPTDHS